MKDGALFRCLLFSGFVLCNFSIAAAQRETMQLRREGGQGEDQRLPGLERPYEYDFKRMRNWTVFGRVTVLGGQVAGGIKIVVTPKIGGRWQRTLQTNLRGEFSVGYELDATAYKTLRVEVVASQPGYRDAWESAVFKAEEGTREIILVLRPEGDDPNVMTLPALITSLGPRLRTADGAGPVYTPARKDYERGAAEFLDKHHHARAIPLLENVVRLEPNCVGCRTLLSLAQLSAGSWVSASRNLAEAAHLNSAEKRGGTRSEPLFILGVMETWRAETTRALPFLLQASELQPDDPLILLELGRALVQQQNWNVAEFYLQKAVASGAGVEARLMRARALLEMGKNEEAETALEASLAGKKPKDLPAPARSLYIQLRERTQLRAIGKVMSVVDQPIENLMSDVPELHGLEVAASQDGLEQLVQRIGEGVESFFRTFPNTSSTEEIREEVLGREGKVVDSRKSKMQYLLMASPAKWGLGLDEYRTVGAPAYVPASESKSRFMRTAGFACAPLVFHPAYQAGSRFRYVGTQRIEGRPASVIAYAQQPEKALPLAEFNVGKTSLPILMQGIAWVDSSNYQIIRMRRDLLTPPPKSRLEQLTTEIHFDEVTFKDLPTALWLPKEVKVTVVWKGKTFRNWHRYSDFRVFKVDAIEKRKPA